MRDTHNSPGKLSRDHKSSANLLQPQSLLKESLNASPSHKSNAGQYDTGMTITEASVRENNRVNVESSIIFKKDEVPVNNLVRMPSNSQIMEDTK